MRMGRMGWGRWRVCRDGWWRFEDGAGDPRVAGLDICKRVDVQAGCRSLLLLVSSILTTITAHTVSGVPAPRSSMTEVSSRPIILLAFANDRADASRYLRNLPKEARQLRAILEPLHENNRIRLIERPNVTLPEILNVFQSQHHRDRIAIFHFGGHSNSLQLMVETPEGKVEPVLANGMGAFLAQQQGLRLVFLNGCANAEQVKALHEAGVGVVIATLRGVDDEVARLFAVAFYQGLTGGATVRAAFEEAKAAVRMSYGEDMRKLYAEKAQGEEKTDEWPWAMYVNPAAPGGGEWKLPDRPVADDGRTFLWVNVPSLPGHSLVGRKEIIDAYATRLTAKPGALLAIDGLPGVGKTTLAVALAYDDAVLAHFTDGVLWAGLGKQPNVTTIQNQWATALGIDLSDVPDPKERSRRISAALAATGRHRVLVVLDDVWDSKAAEALRLSGPEIAHLLTTRNHELALAFSQQARPTTVPVLEEDAALALLQELAPEACAAEPETARTLVKAVGNLPLAVELLGGYLKATGARRFAAQRKQALVQAGDPLTRLQLAAKRLGAADGPEVTLAATIGLSLDGLPAPIQEAFYMLGAFAAEPARFDLAAALAVTGADVDVIGALADRNLIDVAEDESLALHQVLADYARTDMPAEAVERHGAYYLAQVNADREDWQRIEALYEQVRHALEQLPEGDARVLAWVGALRQYWERRGLGPEHLRWAQQALEVARRQDDVATQATLLNNIGLVYSDLGEQAQALAYYEQALLRQVGDKGGEARTLNNIGGVYSALGEKTQALAYYEQALPLRRQAGDKGGEAATLTNMGAVYAALGEKAQALAYYEQALPLQRQVEDKRGEAATLNNIGAVYAALGEKAQALAYLERALPLRRQVGDKGGEAMTLTNMGAVYAALGERAQALAYYEQALPLQRQVEDKRGEAATLNNIGAVYAALGEKAQALAYYEQALPLRHQVGDKGGEATTLNNMATLHFSEGRPEQAAELLQNAVQLANAIGTVADEAACLFNLAVVLHSGLGRTAEAADLVRRSIDLLRRHHLPQDAAGQTIAEHEAFLARLIGAAGPVEYPQ
ncbi:MAG: type I toxin-antitoxin system ptaRNA1 family toxin [Caldilineaceae bacterium]|nr:type I toxin-antitoxin system ptaRNA1 family toxin [Caldilineaceae bacterium]